MDQQSLSGHDFPTSKPVFGSKDRYYASEEKQADSRNGLGNLEKKLSEELLRRYPDLNKTIDRAVRRWNLRVREILRTETGLRLSIGDSRQVVPVKTLDGLPRTFYTILHQAPDREQWILALNQELLEGTRSGIDFISERLDSLTALVGRPGKPEHELAVVYGFVDSLVDKARSFNLLKAILNIEEDIMGAYFFHEPMIGIFWLPISIVALLLGVSIEALTIVVLAHELAHAYTHLGLDIDGQTWNIADFADTDLRIVEGLAQFYSSEVCKKIEADYPAAYDAYSKLLRNQSPPYKSFTEWVSGVEAGGELVRFCMIRTRTQRIHDYSQFLAEVEQGKKLIQSRYPSQERNQYG